MPGTWRYEDCITGSDGESLTINLHRPFAIENKVEFLTLLMVVSFSCTTGRDRGLGETLIAHRRIGAVQDAANPRAILGRKGFLAGYVQDNHREFAPMKFYEGCTALITGASSGLGAEFARQLAPDAHAIVLVARRLERLDGLKSELESAYRGLKVYVYGADLGSEDQRVAFVGWLASQNLKIDFLINNAGLGDQGTFDSSDWNRIKADSRGKYFRSYSPYSPAPPVNGPERSGGDPQCQLGGWFSSPTKYSRLRRQQSVCHEFVGGPGD